MKTELRVQPHSLTPAAVVEVWHDGQMIATIDGSDGPGVRVVTKHELDVRLDGGPLAVAEIGIVVRPRTWTARRITNHERRKGRSQCRRHLSRDQLTGNAPLHPLDSPRSRRPVGVAIHASVRALPGGRGVRARRATTAGVLNSAAGRNAGSARVARLIVEVPMMTYRRFRRILCYLAFLHGRPWIPIPRVVTHEGRGTGRGGSCARGAGRCGR